jgi:hypothetical protein
MQSHIHAAFNDWLDEHKDPFISHAASFEAGYEAGQ